MAKQATKLAPEPETRALAKLPDADSFQNILDSIPRYNEIKSLAGTDQANLAAKDFYHNKIEGLQFIAASFTAAVAFTELITSSKHYVAKWREMFKINQSKAKQYDRSRWDETEINVKTFRSFGIEVPEGITYTANGKEVTVTSDDAIGWTNFCYVVLGRSPQHVNNRLAETTKTIGSTYLPEPETAPPSPIPTNVGVPVTPAPTGEVERYKLVEQDDEDDEDVEDDDTSLLNKLGTRLGNTAPGPTKAMMQVPDLKSGDVDAFIKFNQADSVVGAVPPMDAVFGGLEDFHLAKKVGELARKIVKEYGSDKSVLVVNVTHMKKQKVDELKPVPVCVYHPLAALDAKGLCPECNVFTEADEQV